MKKFISGISLLNMAVLVGLAILVMAGIISIEPVAGMGSFGGAMMLFGVVASVPGYPDYSTETGTKSIPWIFSKKFLVKYYPKSIMTFTSNTKYEGLV